MPCFPVSTAAKYSFPPQTSRFQIGPSLFYPYPIVFNIIITCALASLSLLDFKFLGTVMTTATLIVTITTQAPTTLQLCAKRITSSQQPEEDSLLPQRRLGNTPEADTQGVAEPGIEFRLVWLQNQCS